MFPWTTSTRLSPSSSGESWKQLADSLPATRESIEKLRRYRDLLRQQERIEIARETERFARFATDPVGFVTDPLGGFLWSKQQDICRSVVVNRRTAVKSCHDVGKSAVAARIAAWWLSIH